jgi:hypothetical protein
LSQPDADRHQGDGEVIGDVLEVVADFDAAVLLPVQEVEVIDFTDRRRPNYTSDLRLCVAYMFAMKARCCGVRRVAGSARLCRGHPKRSPQLCELMRKPTRPSDGSIRGAYGTRAPADATPGHDDRWLALPDRRASPS